MSSGEEESSSSAAAAAETAVVEYNVFVKTLTGNTHTVAVNKALTIAQLKQRVQDQTGIPPDQQRIVFAGRQLSNKTTMADASITAETTLHLILRLRPAPGEDDDENATGDASIAPTTAASHPKKGLKRREGDLDTEHAGESAQAQLIARSRFAFYFFRIFSLIAGALAIAMLVIGSIALADGADQFECAYDANIGLALWLVVWSAFIVGMCIVTSLCSLFNRERQMSFALAPPNERADRYPELAMMQRVNNCVGCFLCAWMIVGIVILASVAPVCAEAYEPLWALSIVALALIGFTMCLTCVVSIVFACTLARAASDE
jgi:hypothetical protein